MANVTISPNMGLPVPTVGQDPGPDWANNLVSSLSIVDGHNHSAGSGVQINPSGLSISSDLPFLSNNATLLRSVRFQPQLSPIAGTSPDVGCLYESGVDLYYNDGNGNQIRITQGGSVSGASGTITGLPSGTASAAFSAVSGTFVFQQATSTAANMDIATLVLRYPGSYPTPSGNYISLQVPSGISSGYAFTLPTSTPGAAGAFLTSDTSGALSYTNADNSTLQISGAILQVKPSGINTTQIADGAVTFGKVFTRSAVYSTGPTATGTVGQIVTAALVSVFPVTGLSATIRSVIIATSGRPVMVIVSPGVGPSTVGVVSTGGANASVELSINNTTMGIVVYLADYLSSSGNLNVPPSFMTIDTSVIGSPGTYQYDLTAIAGITNGAIANVQITAYEMF